MIIIDNNGVQHKLSDGRWPNEEERARLWRDHELAQTDWVAAVSDHPEYASYMSYRQALRDWPTSNNFPSNKPVRV